VQLGELVDKHKELENAHVVQSKFIQKMQKKMGKLDKYIETIETQEKVILRMQSIIECSSSNKTKQSSEAVKKDAKFDHSTAAARGISTERVSEDDSKLEECRSTIAEKEATIASITQRMAELQFSNTSLQEQNAQLQRESESNNGKDAEIRRLMEAVNSYEGRSSSPAIPENSQKRDESSLQQEVRLTKFFFSPHILNCYYILLLTIYFLHSAVSTLHFYDRILMSLTSLIT
jgi:predicted RNase H-like nuclease (RuvC/YqgF family)